MEYVIADADNNNAFWFERSLPTLELAKHAALKYPDAKYILEYTYDYHTRGIMPTGKKWLVKNKLLKREDSHE